MTPKERAEAAQVDLGILVLMPNKDPIEMETLLESVVSTAELVVYDDHGIAVKHSSRAFRHRKPDVWQELKSAFWGAVLGGLTPFAIFDKVLRPRLHDIVGEDLLLPTPELGARAARLRRQAA